MADSDPALIGVQKCGCVTLVAARPDDYGIDREMQRSLNRIVKEGGQVIRTTVGEAKAMPDFLNWECPHDPKGWEAEPYVDPDERVSLSKNYAGWTVSRGGRRVGDVRRERKGGDWFATTGWFRSGTVEATDGSEEKLPVDVSGPFRTRREAVNVLTEAVHA